jgi:NAD(P)-dependent dehydrogenase (short-subunit alcohol dehydrogenase family)
MFETMRDNVATRTESKSQPLEAFHDLLPTLASTLDVAEVFQHLSAIAARVVPHDEAHLALLTEDGTQQNSSRDRSQSRHRPRAGGGSPAARCQAGLRRFAAALQPLGRARHACDLDVTDEAQIQRAREEVDALDVLINNAGVMRYDDSTDRAVLEQSLAVQFIRKSHGRGERFTAGTPLVDDTTVVVLGSSR